MKRIALNILLCIIMLLSCAASANAGDKALIAIMDFENKAQYGGRKIGSGASDMLATHIVKTGAFRVMERDKLATIMKEQKLGLSGLVDSSSAVRVGKLLGVQYIVTGAVTEYGHSKSGGGGGGVRVGKKGYQAAVDVRMIDAETGEIVFADTGSGSKASINVKVFGFGGGERFNEKHATEAMRGAINEVSQKLSTADISAHAAAKAKPSGAAMIADVDGNTITLNQGSNGGFKVGQEVSISRKGRVIKDPVTGEVIKVKYRKVGMVKLTDVESGYSDGTIVSGSDFAVGDVVR